MQAMVAISTKGQVVIPKKIRDELDLETGDRLFVSVEDGTIMLKKPKKTLWDFVGTIPGRGLSIEEEEEIAMEGLARHVLYGED